MHSVNFLSPFTSGFIAIITILIGVFLKERKAKILSIILSIIGVIVAFLPLQFLMSKASLLETPPVILFLGFFAQIIISIITISSIIIAANDDRYQVSRFETYPLLLLSFSGMLFTTFAENIIGIYLGLEIISICGYILASLNKSSLKSNESGLKYYIIGALSSCLMVYGFSLIYGFTGNTFNLNEVSNEVLLQNKFPLTVGFLLFAFGIFFKTTTFPFHIWASDSYFGMNTPALSFISIAPKVVAFFVLFKISILMISAVDFISEVFMLICAVLSALSLIVGSFAGIRQNSIKKIMAYSGVVHMGFILSIFSVNNTVSLAGAIIYYFLIYSFINMGIFAVISALQKNPAYDGSLTSIKGLYKTNPFLASSLAILMFSSAGIPPLSGFFIKYSILSNLVREGAVVLPIIAIIASVVSSFYYLKVVKTIYFEEQNKDFKKGSQNKVSIFIKLLIAITVFTNLVFLYV